MEFVSVVVCSDDVQQKDVFRLEVQARYPELHLRKHLPEIRKGSLYSEFQTSLYVNSENSN